MAKLAVTYLPIKNIKSPDRDSRYELDVSFLSALTESIKQFGVLVPLHVRTIEGSDFYERITGKHRLAVAKKLNIESVPCVIHRDLSREDFLVLRGTLDMQRQVFDVLAISRDMVELQRTFKWSLRRIAKKYGISRTWAMKLCAIWRMIPEIRQAIYDGDITVNDAYEHLRSRERSIFPKSLVLTSPKRRVSVCHICGRELSFFLDYRKIKVCNDCLPNIVCKKHSKRLPPSSSLLV